jgi:beta-aspartyl-peptidase (threonine type)
MPKPTLLIHGGACSQLTDPAGSEVATATAALHQALDHGSAVLDRGGSALDAVQMAVATLEESGALNAGRGAVCDAEGKRLLDAMLMDGATQGIGAVAGVQFLRNPIHLARVVLDQTRHCLLIGNGAERLADARGLARVNADWFCAPPPNQPVAHGTVGAVALDADGRLAAATSTGGTTAKLPGRVGDSPLAGAGTWADRHCAVSATGIGEYFIRTGFAHRIAWAVASGTPVATAIQQALSAISRFGGWGGGIALTAQGDLAATFACAGMWRGVQRCGEQPMVLCAPGGFDP